MLGIIFLLLLTMYMIDRQWKKIDSLQNAIDEQGRDIRSLRSATVSSASVRLHDSSRVDDLPMASGSDAFSKVASMSHNSDYAEGDWLVVPLESSLKTISPVISSEKNASSIQTFVIESLLIRDPESLEWTGLLAESWVVSDDGLIFDFKLRPEAGFSDGSRLTAEDVKFSYEFVMDEKIAAPALRSYLEKINSVEVLDMLSVRFILKEPYFAGLSLLGELPVLSSAYYRKYLQNSEQYNQSKGLLFGSGPYRLVNPEQWSPESGRVELVRNNRYWGPVVPSLDRLVWKIIENENARLTTFRNGELDAYTAEPREFEALREEPFFKDKASSFDFMPPFQGYSYIGWNTKKSERPTFFADQRVRLAMTLLTDRARIIDEIKLGFAEAVVSPFNQNSKQHDPQLTPRPYDPEQAAQLLAESGFADRDGNGVLENSDGIPFEFELVFFQGREETRRIVLLLKDIYARAGIVLTPKPTDWPVMIDLLRNRNFDAIALGWTSGVETDIYQMFHSSQIASGGDNFVGFQHSRFDDLVEQARSTVDEAERMQIWRKAEAILYEQQPYTFLYRSKVLRFYDARIKNLLVTKMGMTAELTPLEVYVPANQQKYTH